LSTVRRTFDLDPAIDARINALAAEKGHDAAAVVFATAPCRARALDAIASFRQLCDGAAASR
jgi:hypothetical protein